MIEVKDIEKLAALARIHLSPEEVHNMPKEISSILEYIDQIQVASGSVDRKLPDNRNIMREDCTPHEPGIHTEALIAEAPRKEKNYVKVKKIL